MKKKIIKETRIDPIHTLRLLSEWNRYGLPQAEAFTSYYKRFFLELMLSNDRTFNTSRFT